LPRLDLSIFCIFTFIISLKLMSISYSTFKLTRRLFGKSSRQLLYSVSDLPLRLGLKADLLQIVGFPRSGTTLLTGIVNGLNGVVCLSEPYLQWEYSGQVELPGKVESQIENRAQKLFPSFLLRRIADLSNVQVVGFKETFMKLYEPQALFLQGNLKTGCADYTIIVVRDPRDIWASLSDFMDGTSQEYQWWKRVQSWYPPIWNEYCEWALNANARIITYEDMVRAPMSMIADVSSYLQVPPPESIHVSATGIGDEMALSGRPISTNSIGRYRERLTEEEIALIETNCADMMHHFGYVTS